MLAAASEAERALEKFRLGDDPCLRVRATLREFVESLLSSEFVLARPVNLWLLLLLLLLLQLLPPPPLLPKFARWSALGDAGDGDPSTNHPQPSSPPPSRRGESGAALAAAAEVSEPLQIVGEQYPYKDLPTIVPASWKTGVDGYSTGAGWDKTALQRVLQLAEGTSKRTCTPCPAGTFALRLGSTGCVADFEPVTENADGTERCLTSVPHLNRPNSVSSNPVRIGATEDRASSLRTAKLLSIMLKELLGYYTEIVTAQTDEERARVSSTSQRMPFLGFPRCAPSDPVLLVQTQPVVLFMHGFPESWFSWRHQLKAVKAAGYRGIAPDCRGYGGTDAPQDYKEYTVHAIAADMIADLTPLRNRRGNVQTRD